MTMGRVALAWICYGLGDLAWRWGADAWPGNYWEWPYRVYNRLMVWSDALQGDDQRGPWEDVVDR